MKKHIVAIIGRPNVGKSTLFNKIVGKRTALVADMPGVTRDRHFGSSTWNGKTFSLIDTGGFEPVATDGIIAQIKEQSRVAIEEADSIIFLVDGKDGVTSSDEEVLKILRKSGSKFILAVNKIDDNKHSDRVYDFYSMGIGDVFPVSAEHSSGISELLDHVTKDMPHCDDEEVEIVGDVKISVVGKPNVGKSSLINKILGEKRLLVSDVAGTTMDSIDTLYIKDDKRYCFVDTAGMRKKRKISQRIEKYSTIMSTRSIDRSDIALVLIDAEGGVNEQDVKIAGMVHEAGKGAIVVLNKWDKVEKETNTLEEFKKDVLLKLKYMSYAPVISISALTGQRVGNLFSLIDRISEEQRKDIKTSMLNSVLENAVKRRHPSSHKGKRVKFYYITQVKKQPPTFLLFTNYPEGVHFSYRRYLLNEFRKEFGFFGTPIEIVYKKR